MKRHICAILASAALLASSCGTTGYTRESQYPEMYKEKPVTLLVMPPMNNTSAEEATTQLYISINRPFIEAGFYVVSPMISMDILKSENLYDSKAFFHGDLQPLLNIFGADAVVFTEIDAWEKVGVGIHTDIRYIIRSTHTGQTLFDRRCDLFLDLSVNSGHKLSDILFDITVTALSTAFTDNIKAARNSNYFVVGDIPRGKYSPIHDKDQEQEAEARNITKWVMD